MLKRIALISTVGALTASSALAAVDATATTELNLRSGPSPQAEIIDVIPGEAMVSVDQCMDVSQWCRVDYNGQQGWAYGAYLNTPIDGQAASVYENRTAVEVETVTEDNDQALGNSLTAGMTGGMMALAAAAGPAGIAAAAAGGVVAGALATPQETVTTYVVENPTEPVYVQGEVVTGAGVPEEVTLQTIPDSEYKYVYLNGVPVVVDADRRVVTVVR
ncbi:hypothetical protein ATO6_07790 [Oceanicola sp. 22II-s10i]|uniref:DUF1236 domain-containing protein n=1 Tax=Oceanicola sp. 22II-s10i TaxID=1317116 RepID=UPI000B522CA4|nr:DUF1236 domain-containing protein [Oceanicola sp. 22II-s10i]OWU86666.1 hypothetical protein ATO6_07790 [Oceanicola sp. 22II-s10i]